MSNITVTLVVNGARNNIVVPDATTVSQLLGDANYRAIYGIPANAEAVVNGAPSSGGSYLRNGDVISFRTRASEKGANITVTLVVNGARNNIVVPDGTTVSQLLSDANYRAIYGIPANAEAVVNGAAGTGTYLRNGDVVSFRTRASEKG